MTGRCRSAAAGSSRRSAGAPRACRRTRSPAARRSARECPEARSNWVTCHVLPTPRDSAMATVAELMHQNLFGVFGERDASRRAAVAAVTYREDVVFHDPEGSVTGRHAVVAKVQALLDGAPGFVFAPRGPLH